MPDDMARASPLAAHYGKAAVLRSSTAATQACEVPFLTQLNLRGNAGDAAFLDAVRTALDAALPLTPNTTSVGADPELRVLWLGPDEWLVLAPPDREDTLAGRLRTALAGQHAAVTAVGHGHTAIDLSGPDARRILAQGCPLDFHPRRFVPGQCAQSHLGKALITIVQLSDAPAYRIVVRRSFADYLWSWLLRALGVA